MVKSEYSDHTAREIRGFPQLVNRI
jgi:hypothetical protein